MVSVKTFTDLVIDLNHFSKIFENLNSSFINEKELIDIPFKKLIKVKLVLNGIMKNNKDSVLLTNNLCIPKSLM